MTKSTSGDAPGDSLDEASGSEDDEIGSEAASQVSQAADLMAEFYRIEMAKTASIQTRIDQTANWAVTVMAAFLTVVFSQPNIAAYVLLIGIVALCGFLFFETRRYQTYDASYSRARMLETNFFANVFHPTGTEHDEWRKEMSDDLRTPTLKMSFREALSHRLRRVYGPLLTVLGIAWMLQITLFTPQTRWIEAAAISAIPGSIVVGGVGVFYLLALLLAFWPTRTEAKTDFHGTEVGDWDRSK